MGKVKFLKRGESKFMAKTKKKVLVGMSGGVDSSVTACLLKEQGYEVIGIHLRFWVDPTAFSPEDSGKFPQNKCCTLEGLARTRQMASKLGIPFYVVNFEEAFKRDVVDFFIDGYGNGITPNPCVECNRKIKFGLFFQKMKELGADYIATGHYARILRSKVNGKNHYELWESNDKRKDQSYFLYTLTQEKLAHTLFPIGNFTKPEVREMAKKFGIEEVNRQKESQNLCFFPESKHGAFLQRYLKQQHFETGDIVTTTGEIIGKHRGLPNYTIGQRKGLGIGGIKGMETEGNPWYVIRIERALNQLVVGHENDLCGTSFSAHTINFIDGYMPSTKAQLKAKIRYHFPAQPAILKLDNIVTEKNGITGKIEFTRPQRAITPGQSVVFYEDERVVGGGIIA